MKIQRFCLSGIVLWAGFLWSGQSFAEERFRDLVFANVVVESGVEFGAGLRPGSVNQPLLMDIYSPAGDSETQRPAIVLAFPGGFVDGARDNPEMVLMASQFARRGYVAASIDYRLIEDRPDSRAQLEVRVLQAVHDMRAAIRFFREDAATGNQYGTDGQHVFVGGISAGAVMAGATAMFDEGDELGATATQFLADNGGVAGNSSNNTQFSSAASGVLQISGAISELDWIEPDSPPIYAAHEEFDPIVPCRTSIGLGFVGFGLALRSSGACDMIPAARDVGVPTAFFFDEGSLDHIGYSDNDFLDILAGSAGFFLDEVLRPRSLATAVLPASRSVQVGQVATVFASAVNASANELTGCRVEPMTDVPADFSYRTANAVNSPVGEADAPFSMAPNATQNLLLSFVPTNDFSATDVFLRYICDDGAAASNARGLNSVLLSSDDNPVADIIGLTTVVDLLGAVDATTLFAVGSANVGVGDEITVTVDDGGAELPLQLQLCRTDSATGACSEPVAQSSSLTYEAASTASFVVFATPTGAIANDPARHRIFVRFVDANGRVRGATSTAVRSL